MVIFHSFLYVYQRICLAISLAGHRLWLSIEFHFFFAAGHETCWSNDKFLILVEQRISVGLTRMKTSYFCWFPFLAGCNPAKLPTEISFLAKPISDFPWLFLPSGKHTKSHGKSPWLIGQSIISMAIFNSELLVYWRLLHGICKITIFIG